jgi:protein-tyrosine-phosphatase
MEGEQKVITVVCTGNICRSPMAEHLLRHALANEGEPFRSFKVISAGVSAYPGDPASRNAVEAMRKVQIDLSDHRSRPLSDQVLAISDLILTMTSSHAEIIRLQNPHLAIPVHLFREWIPSGDREVPDPFGGPLQLYADTRDALAEAIPSVLNFLKTRFEQ